MSLFLDLLIPRQYRLLQGPVCSSDLSVPMTLKKPNTAVEHGRNTLLINLFLAAFHDLCRIHSHLGPMSLRLEMDQILSKR